jgi:hypothetical protein
MFRGCRNSSFDAREARALDFSVCRLAAQRLHWVGECVHGRYKWSEHAVGAILFTLSDSPRADGVHHHWSLSHHRISSKFFCPARASEMRKTNYSFEKRQREVAKQKKREAKRLKKTEKADQRDNEDNPQTVV